MTRNILMIIGFIILQSLLFYLFLYIGIPALPSSLAVDFVIAFVFTLFNFRGNLKGFYKNPYFYKMFAIYLLIFGTFTILSYFVF